MKFYIFIIGTFLFLNACGSKSDSDNSIHEVQLETNPTEAKLLAVSDAIKNNPENPELYYKRAKLYLEAGEDTLALNDIIFALEKDSINGKYYFIKSKAYRAINKIKLSLKAAEKAELLQLKNPELFILIGEMYYIVMQYQKAFDYMNKALRITPFNADAYFYKGMIYAEIGDTARAISNLQTAIEQTPEYVEAHNNLVRLFNARKEYDIAMQYINSGLRYNAANPFLYYNKGVTFQYLNELDTSKACYLKALEFDPEFYLAHYNLGVLAFNERNYDDAEIYFLNAINAQGPASWRGRAPPTGGVKSNQQMSSAYYLLGRTYEYRARKKEAIPQYEMAVSLDSLNQDAAGALKKLKRKIYRKKVVKQVVQVSQDSVKTVLSDTIR
ncbi:MAG: tetratricopeptide repeat protein [Cytophagales bacterium]|nr:tetratricopeptide repeat protein [Cytophagales bacterium]